ncbi:hypothetical protein PHYBOEH_006975 [Phytophthora boehmeriae]|uniref:Nucleolar protein 12 n=1 Tax=Phytophthora boehmeriae TaxID=109152 RepID=A0A8T1WBE8_9STRA|nr:hypothetical protein PHYBOEH_006975 [Phytophthora boehmeriae]
MVHGATSRAGKRGPTKKGGIGSTGGLGARPSVRKKSKLVITFDADKRKEYLTGFHKRKQERRRFGLDMEAYKVKKRLLEAKKQRREEQKEKLAALNLLDDEKKQDEEQEDDEEDEDLVDSDSEPSDHESKTVLGGNAVTKIMTFDDDYTQGKFGDVVTVTTQVGDLKSDSEDELSDDDLDASDNDQDDAKPAKRPDFKHKKKFDKEQHLTLFQRIQQQRKGKALPSKRSKLKEARTARNAMLGKKGGALSGKKRGAGDDGDRGSASNKLNKKLKLKRGPGGSKSHKKR